MPQFSRDKQGQKSDTAEKIQLVHSGSEYFKQLAALINRARESIELLVYIFDEDETGQSIAQALIEAAKRGVRVLVLVDGFGSNGLSRQFIQNLKNNGIRFRKFSPYLTGDIYSIGRRMHIKLAIADTREALLGGINISNHYNDNITTAWLDYAVLVRNEYICKGLKDFCSHLFEKELTKRVMDNYKLVSTDIEVLINDWFLQQSSIHRSFKTLIENSKVEITIMASYFLPGQGFMKRLAQAAQRGVTIHLINSAHWDIPFMKGAIHYFYPWLQRNNIKLYEWQPSVLHAKVMVVDKKICTIGSYNLNSLSRYNSLEMNVNIKDEKVVKQLYYELEEIKTNSSKAIRIDHYKANPAVLFINWLNYQLIRLALKMMLLFMKEDKEVEKQ